MFFKVNEKELMRLGCFIYVKKKKNRLKTGISALIIGPPEKLEI